MVFAVSACAQGDNFYDEQLRESGATGLKDELSDETNDYLDRLGYGDMDFSSMLACKPGRLINLLLLIVKGKLPGLLKITARLLAVIIIIAIAESFYPEKESSQAILTLISGVFVILTIFTPASAVISAGAAAIGVCAGFERALIPVLAAVLTASGSPMLAISYQGMAFAAAQGITTFVNSAALPLVGTCCVMGMTGAVSPALNLSSVSELIRKVMLAAVSIAAAMFSGILALKNVLAASADTLAGKGVKLAVNSFIPVLGGAISEAYSSIIGSIALIKSTIGAFSIAAVFITIAPVLIELIMWTLALRISGVCAELLSLKSTGEILRVAGTAMSLTAVLTVYCGLVFIITSALVITLKGGG